MSYKAYQEILNQTCEVFDKILAEEDYLQERAKKLRKIKNARQAHTTVYRIYAAYIRIVKNLEQCYDQMLQPQKRVVLRILLEASIGRLLELKDELVNLDMSDFNYDDDALIQLHVTPDDLELKVPRFIAREREAERLERKKLMDAIYLKLHPPEPTEDQKKKAEEEEKDEDKEDDELEGMLQENTEPVPTVKEEEKAPEAAATVVPTVEEKPAEELPPEEQKTEGETEEPEEGGPKVPKIRETPQHRREMFAARAVEREKARQELKKQAAEKRMEEIRKAIFLIQVHERARQARYSHQFVLNVSSMQASEGQKRVTKEEKELRELAATKIQRFWRMYREKRKHQHREEQQKQLLWMVRKNGPLDKTQQKKAQEVCRLNYGPQADYQEDYEYAMQREYEEYQERRGPWVKEEITDEIRDWFREWYTKVRNFPPDYPKEEDGGSLVVKEGNFITPEEWEIQKEKEEAEKKKGGGKKKPKKTKEQIKEEKKKAKALELKKKKEEEKKRKQDEKENPGFKMEASKYLQTLFDENEKYNEVWRNKDESSNPDQTYYLDMIKQEQHLQVDLEVRKIVDELMRLELDQLKVAVEKDIAKSKGKKYKPKKKKKKKKRKKGKKKEKKTKDLTGDRTVESLIEELMEAGILVHPIPEIRVEQLNGDYNLTAYEKRLLMDDPVPAVGDTRNLLYLYCILPFGSPLIRQTSPLVKAVCIVGPKDSGKHMMVNAVCTETGAYLFDISPEVIAGKYKGRSGTRMFDHLMNKMTRLLQPSVVFIDGAEKPFYKKVPKDERQFEPKRLSQWLPKFAKGIKPEDQVMVIGTSHQPWKGSPAKLTRLYNKFIFIPRTDYSTIETVWQEQIMRNHLVSRNLDLSALARNTTGLPVGVIKYLTQKVLSRKRILELPMKPLTVEEIFEASLNYDPVTDDEFQKFLDFFSKRTKLGRKRAQVLLEYKILQEKLEKLKKKQKKKK